MRYFDYWLKNQDNGAMDGAPVRIQLRTGGGAHYILEEQEWPIARTVYRRWYLDAHPSTWKGKGPRQDHLRIAEEVPSEASSASYAAHLDIGKPALFPGGFNGGTPRWRTGVSFVSEPLTQDLTIAGYMKAGLWVASSSTDMDVFVSLRVIDENDQEIRYESLVHPVDPVNIHPVGHGLLKVSHRKLDTVRSSDYFPFHTHAEADYAPLSCNEVVAIEVGLYPSTALIRRGCRLRVDIQPYSPAGLPVRAYDESYHAGATNSICTGIGFPSYVQLPVLPEKIAV